MKQLFNKNLHWPLLILVFILLIVMSFLSEGFYGGADNVSHYFISRYSFKYPHLFLNPWGRPVFTIMSSPFSQFGFQGLKIFNVILGCLTAFLAFLTARKLGISRAWLAILFVIFTPMYFIMTLTGLTEIQFGFILILSVYLFFDEKFIASAIIISFIPLSRSEGFLLLPIFLLAFLMKKKFVPIPFLITGLLFFSVLGYFFVFKDFFWIFTHSPYPLHHPVYTQKGPLLRFILASPEIFGVPLLILFLAGIGLYVFLFFLAEKKHRLQIFLEIWLLVVPVLLFFAVHSILYWKALYGSMGLTRVVTGLLPLAAIVSVKAYNHLENLLFLRIFRKIFLFTVILLVISSNFMLHRYPVPLSPGEQAVRAATRWIKNSPLIKQKIFFTDIDIPFLLDLDPYDSKQSEQKIGSKWLLGFPVNTVIIWDSYYGNRECKIPFDLLEKSGAYRLLNFFKPDPSPDTWVDPSYQICIYKKAPFGIHVDNKVIRDSIMARTTESGKVRFITGYTFEKKSMGRKDPHISAEVARSGSFSYKTVSWEEFIFTNVLDVSKIISRKEDVTFRVTCYLYPLIPFKENDTRLVITLKDRNDLYHSLQLDTLATRVNQWNKISFMATFPVIESSDRLVVYFWHRGKKEFYVDDFKIEMVNLQPSRRN